MDAMTCPNCALLQARAETLEREHARLLRLAKRAVNGWACYARRKLEHDEIARLHAAIREAEEARP